MAGHDVSKGPRSSEARLRVAIEADRGRIADGVRPCYHVRWTTSPGSGAVDLTIAELPIIHLFVPDAESVRHGARLLIARTLHVDPGAFDVAWEVPGR